MTYIVHPSDPAGGEKTTEDPHEAFRLFKAAVARGELYVSMEYLVAVAG